MDVNTINPVLSSFISVLQQLGFSSIEKKSVSAIGPSLENPGLLVNVGITGPLKGTINIGMDIDSAKKFASKMMMGREVLELDNLAQSAISEMANMVCANSCTAFSKINVNGLNISPPTLLLGKSGQVKLSVPAAIYIKFLVDNINVDVYVGIF